MLAKAVNQPIGQYRAFRQVAPLAQYYNDISSHSCYSIWQGQLLDA